MIGKGAGFGAAAGRLVGRGKIFVLLLLRQRRDLLAPHQLLLDGIATEQNDLAVALQELGLVSLQFRDLSGANTVERDGMARQINPRLTFPFRRFGGRVFRGSVLELVREPSRSILWVMTIIFVRFFDSSANLLEDAVNLQYYY